MEKRILTLTVLLLVTVYLQAQVEPDAGNWKTWFITSGREYRLSPPPANKEEIAQVLSKQKDLNNTTWHQILYWNTGAPGYRWHEMIHTSLMNDTSYNGVLA